MTGTPSDTVLEVSGLKIHFDLDEGTLKAVDGVDFSISRGATVGIIGESGCGKSITARAILHLVPQPGHIVDGTISFDSPVHGRLDMSGLDPRGELIRSIRGGEISMVFQEPMTSLSPVHTIGSQINEAIRLHMGVSEQEARRQALDMLARVGMSNPRQRIDEYPHQLSGGMRQRVMIAMALSCDPDLLIADEPTTALDVTVQAQILELMEELQAVLGMAMMYITHDLGVIAEIADQVNVMYLGRIVETGSTIQLFDNPLHPYTRRLLKSIPQVGRKSTERLQTVEGTVPVPIDPPWQCGFASRCPEAIAGRCDSAVPASVEIEPGHTVRCFLHSDAEDMAAAATEEQIDVTNAPLGGGGRAHRKAPRQQEAAGE